MKSSIADLVEELINAISDERQYGASSKRASWRVKEELDEKLKQLEKDKS